MQTEEFLRSVLPANGWFFIATPNTTNGFRHIPCESHEEAAQAALQLARNNKHAFFALAGYHQRSYQEEVNGKLKTRFRGKVNVREVKCLWLDLDTGEDKVESGKGYADVKSAARHIVELHAKGDIPQPTYIVRSGNGVHVYWVFMRPLPAKLWNKVAVRFKAAVRQLGIKADIGLTADLARVLRPIGTANVKDPANPRPVVLVEKLSSGVLHEPEAIVSWLKPYKLPSAERKAEIDYTLPWCAGLNGEFPASHAEDMASHCAVLGQMRETKGKDQSYNTWLDSISVLVRTEECKDDYELIHDWSSGHPHYNYDLTKEKIESLLDHQPHKCSTFADSSELCAACPHLGKITNPLRLGYRQPIVDHATEVKDVKTGAVVEVLGDLPLPLQNDFRFTPLRGLEAQVPKRGEDGAITYYWRRIAPTFPRIDFLWRDEDLRETYAHISNRLNVDKWQEGDVAVSSISAGGQALTRELGQVEIVPDHLPAKELEKYMRTWVQHALAHTSKQRLIRHMGWQEDGSFVLGTRVYFPDGRVEECLPNKSLVSYMKAHTVRGDLKTYVRGIDRLYNHKSRVAHQIMWMAAFASPLLALYDTANVGLVLSAVSTQSGTGKTTAAMTGISVWGDPSANGQTASSTNATPLALNTMAGQRKHLPVLVDETTGWSVQQISDFLYNYSFGVAKLQAQASGGLRDNSYLNWQNILYLTSNTSASGLMMAGLGNAGPRIARLFEVHFPEVDLKETDPEGTEIVKEMMREHHGVAGDAYIRALIKLDPVQVRLVIQQKIRDIEKALNVGSDARFWVLFAAVQLVAFALTARLKLHRFNRDNFTAGLYDAIRHMATLVKESRRPADDILSSLLADLAGGIIRTETVGDAKKPVPIIGNMVPKSSLTGRSVFSGPEKGIYLSRKVVRRWCAKEELDFTQIETQLADGQKPYLSDSRAKFNIGKGTPYATGRAECWKLDIDRVQDNLTVVGVTPPKQKQLGEAPSKIDVTALDC